jgi:hypothetical protein
LQAKLDKVRGAKKQLLDKQKRIGVAMKGAAKVSGDHHFHYHTIE